MWLQSRKGDTKWYYKTSLVDDTFKTTDLKEKPREKGIVLPVAIPPMRLTKRKISNEKYRVPEEDPSLKTSHMVKKKRTFPRMTQPL